LKFRDLLEAKMHYSSMLVRDLAVDTSCVFGLGPTVSHEYEYLRLYNFDRHDSEHPPDQVATEEWVAYMDTLSRYEAPVACERFDFSAYRRMLDIGGNTGQFALTVCEQTPGLHAVVFDLPGVVRIGQRVHAKHPSSDRVDYVGGDAFGDDPPEGCDLVSFKSTLHDWPDDKAESLLEQGWFALEPGGTLLIFERSHADLEEFVPMPFSQLTILGWAWIFRGPHRYEETLRRLGCTELQVDQFDLDMPWMLLTATKPST
jgi:hypothetical protein